MPSIITHGVVALALAAKSRQACVKNRIGILLTSTALAMLPDADYFGFKMGIQYNSLFGHRGFTHSFFFAALVAFLAAFAYSRSKFYAGKLGGLFLLFFAVTASHGLLDAMSDGGEGVAFFSPFSNHRYFFPYRPILVSPLGVEAFFSSRGALVLINELLLVIMPLCLVLFLADAWKRAKKRRALSLALLIGWIVLLVVLKGLHPLNNVFMTLHHTDHPVIDLYVKKYGNPLILRTIPTQGIRGGKLVTNFLELQKLGLFNSRFEAKNVNSHWASGFFPSWYGGIGGRWQDTNLHLLLRTLVGYGVADSREIQEVLKDSAAYESKRDFLFRLAPTEKYDLALGDYDFKSTRSILSVTHNSSGLPKYWYGICNGMAAASKWYEEPFRVVDVVNPNGFKIRFHPNDVKALLGYAQANAAQWTEIGTRCNVNGPEAENCRVNSGAFFLATMNRIALAHDSFIVDGFSGTRKQFYLFDAVRVEVLSPPSPVDFSAPTPVKTVAKVRFTMDFVSTLLSDKDGDNPDEARGEGYYKRVGRVVVPRVLDAMIAMDEYGEVVGGAWLSEGDIPDVFFFSGPTPAVDNQNRLTVNTNLNWGVIESIYEQSISKEPKLVPLDFSL